MIDYQIIIQARNGSTRMPRKMEKEFHKNKTILQLLIERLQFSFDYPIWLATTTNLIDDELVKTVSGYKIKILRGDENNVFSRFKNILKKNYSTRFIRICGDNPFLHIDYLKNIIDNSEGHDYTSYYALNKPTIKTHYGIFSEVIRSETFLEFESKKMSQTIKEHVTPFLYDDEEKYKIKKLSLPQILYDFNYLRLTVDTHQDFELAQLLYEKHNIRDGLDYDLNSLLTHVKEEEEIQIRMMKQIQINTK